MTLAVAGAWGWGDAELTAISGGLINATYAVRRDGTPIAVLQRLHPVFGAAVNLDIDAVTTHLAGKGMVTPRLVRTLDGAAWVEDGEAVWRALTWIDGDTVHRVPDVAWAEAGGVLVGRFHRAVADLQHDYAFARTGVHDTAAHLARLQTLVDGGSSDDDQSLPRPSGQGSEAPYNDAAELGRQILATAAALPALPAIPRRHTHGDLKISNLLFGAGPVGICLVDLDTLGLSTLAFELGDAMRSWCNPRGEDAGAVGFDLAIFEAAMRGFRAVADPIVSADERRAIVIGLETVCIELAARFAIDVFRDEYFGWDAGRFPTRRAHNLVRARGQLALGLTVRQSRHAALDILLAGG